MSRCQWSHKDARAVPTLVHELVIVHVPHEHWPTLLGILTPLGSVEWLGIMDFEPHGPVANHGVTNRVGKHECVLSSRYKSLEDQVSRVFIDAIAECALNEQTTPCVECRLAILE